QQRGDVGAVGLAVLRHGVGVGQVVLAVGHAQSALHQRGDVARRAFEATRDEYAEQVAGVEVGEVERIGVGTYAGADVARQRGDRINGVDLIQHRLQRRQAALLDAILVHVRGVVVGDPARVAAGGRVGLLQALDQVGGALFGQL